MFVVVEWNQASGRPSLVNSDVYDRRADAQEVADEALAYTKSCGRRERYTVHELSDEEIEG